MGASTQRPFCSRHIFLLQLPPLCEPPREARPPKFELVTDYELQVADRTAGPTGKLRGRSSGAVHGGLYHFERRDTENHWWRHRLPGGLAVESQSTNLKVVDSAGKRVGGSPNFS